MSIGFAPTRPAADFSPVDLVPEVVFIGEPSSIDCCAQVAALLDYYPTFRAMVGSVLVWVGNSPDSTLAAWQRPWGGHAWMVDPQGRVHDSALWNLEKLPNLRSQLPKAVEDLRARVIPYGTEQEAAVRSLLSTPRSSQCPRQQLVYAPGCVFVDSAAEMNDEVAFWAAAAHVSAQRGGYSAEEFKRLMRVQTPSQETTTNV
jgi:hypothetical protein